MTKLLFVVLPTIPCRKFSKLDISAYKGAMRPSIPLGIASISAYLKANVKDVTVDAVDCAIAYYENDRIEELSYTEFISGILQPYQNSPPDIVAIAALYNFLFTNAVETSKIVKRLFPQSLLLVGGSLTANLYKELLTETPEIDALCYGEGEQPLLDLITAEDIQTHLNTSDSWITSEKIKNDPEKQYVNQFVADYDALPFPDYDLFGMDRYQAFSRDHSKKKEKYSVSVMFSRGCQYNCHFCIANALHGRKVRYYSIGKAKEYITYIVDKYHANILLIEDNNFLFNKKWTLEIIRFLTLKKIEFDITNGIYINSIDEELVLRLKEAGLDQMLFPVESGSGRVLKELMNKRTDLNHAKHIIRFCYEQGLQIQANFIVGYPGETSDDIEKTKAFIDDVGDFDWVRFAMATPFHGTRLYKECKEKGYLITDDYDMYSADDPIIKTPDFTPEDVRKLSYSLNLLFNFIKNHKMKTGDYEGALKRFLEIEKKIEGHAFALYYSAICCDKLERRKEAGDLLLKYKKAIEENPDWKMWSEYYHLPFPPFYSEYLLPDITSPRLP